VVDQKEETRGFVPEERGEGEGLEQTVEQPNEADLLIAERAIIGFERVEKEPKENSLLSDENTVIPILFPPLKISQTYP